MNLASVVKYTKQHKLLSFSIGAALALGIVLPVGAAYPVHDKINTAKVVEQIKKATEQIAELKKQIDLQVQNLQNLKTEHVQPILNEIGLVNDEYAKLKASKNDLIKGGLDARDAITKTFHEFKDLDLRQLSYKEIGDMSSANRKKQQDLTVDILNLIQEREKDIEKSNKRVKELSKLISETKGAKDLAQLQALLENEQLHAQNINNEILALRTKQEAIKLEMERLEREAGKAMQEKVIEDFKQAKEELKDYEIEYVKTNTPTFSNLVRGWR